MAYRKRDIPGMIECLKGAYKHLPEWGFLCIAVCRDDHSHSSIVKQMIVDSLGVHYTLEGFLGVRSLDNEVRVAWIDKMIADLQEYAKS